MPPPTRSDQPIPLRTVRRCDSGDCTPWANWAIPTSTGAEYAVHAIIHAGYHNAAVSGETTWATSTGTSRAGRRSVRVSTWFGMPTPSNWREVAREKLGRSPEPVHRRNWVIPTRATTSAPTVQARKTALAEGSLPPATTAPVATRAATPPIAYLITVEELRRSTTPAWSRTIWAPPATTATKNTATKNGDPVARVTSPPQREESTRKHAATARLAAIRIVATPSRTARGFAPRPTHAITADPVPRVPSWVHNSTPATAAETTPTSATVATRAARIQNTNPVPIWVSFATIRPSELAPTEPRPDARSCSAPGCVVIGPAREPRLGSCRR